MSWPDITPTPYTTVGLHNLQLKDLCPVAATLIVLSLIDRDKTASDEDEDEDDVNENEDDVLSIFYLQNVEAEMSRDRMRKRNLSSPVFSSHFSPTVTFRTEMLPTSCSPPRTLPAWLSHDLTPPLTQSSIQPGPLWLVNINALRQLSSAIKTYLRHKGDFHALNSDLERTSLVQSWPGRVRWGSLMLTLREIKLSWSSWALDLHLHFQTWR